MSERREVVAWSAAVCASAVALAGFTQRLRWLFVAAIVIAVAALAILLVAGVPDLFAWLRTQVGGTPTQGPEIMVRRRFAMDWENSRSALADVEVVLANNSTVDVTITKIGLKPIGFSGPTKLVGGPLPLGRRLMRAL